MIHATHSDDREVQAQVCAFNTAFEELDLMFRWDAQTYRALASADSDYGKIAQYIETHCSASAEGVQRGVSLPGDRRAEEFDGRSVPRKTRFSTKTARSGRGSGGRATRKRARV